MEHKKGKINEKCVQKVCWYIRWTEAGLQMECGEGGPNMIYDWSIEYCHLSVLYTYVT